MGGAPIGLDWPSIYPLMDRQKDVDWDDLLDALAVMEEAAMQTIREFAPKSKE
jgi:hypothetical protein